MATNQGFKNLVPDSRALDSKFLYWWLRWKRPALEAMGNGATFKEISKQVTASIEIVLPPIEEQQWIAAVLNAADALRAKRRRALSKLDAVTQATFVGMFGLPAANPAGYPVAPMIDLVDPTRPITYGILKPGEDMPDGVPYVRVVDMFDGSINAPGLRRTSSEISSQYKRSLLRQGDLLLSIRGHVGRLALVESDVAGANITQDTARLAITGANPVYVLECLRSPELQGWMSTFTKGAAVKGINLTDVKKMAIPLPSVSDQAKFADIVRIVQRTRRAHISSVRQLADLFASLQRRAFRGEL
jgi:type I restriction enzyme S subunit